MSDAFLGEIKIGGWNFAPKGYAFCNGQLLSIQQNAALFSLLGTYYGGNGVNNFALPNLQSRVPVHFGQGLGLSSYTMGQVGGEENHTLTSSEMPTHQHALMVGTAAANTPKPSASLLSTADLKMFAPASNLTTLHPASVGQAGGNLPHSNQQPYLVMNFVIALQGVFPSRN